MSAVRGIEIHNGYISIPDGMSVVIATSLTSGTIRGHSTEVKVAADGTVNVDAIRGKATVNADVALAAGAVIGGGRFETELGSGAAAVDARIQGLEVAVTIPDDAGTLGQIYGLLMTNYIETDPGGYTMIRLSEHGPATVTIEDLIHFYIPRAAVTRVFRFDPQNKTDAWASHGDKTGGHTYQNGWLEVLLGGLTRYIQLYTG